MNPKSITADQAWVRKKNRSIILDTLRIRRTLSRAGLAVETGLNPSTVSNIINELLDENLVRRKPISSNPSPGVQVV